MTSAAQVHDVIEPAVRAAGCDLEDVEVRAAGRRQLVRVLIDADGGISLDQVAEVSRAVSVALDEADARLGFGAYVLEVSSPGVDRPLTLPRHFRRAHGRLITANRKDGQSVTGRVVDYDDTTVTLETKGGEVTLSYTDISSAQVQVEFNHGSVIKPARGEELDADIDLDSEDEVN
ncbi:MAG: ribosome maturation factor RimP [Actinobacteria bacterium]|nr:ribosome maturation factor RimP [Actinomycetota bacterium]